MSPPRPAALAVLAVAALAGPAAAQSMTGGSASMNAGWGRTSGQENRTVELPSRDASGNRLIVDGVIQSDGSSYSSASASSSAKARAKASAYAGGVGEAGGTASAIGNSLNVVTYGNNNTVVVNSHQVNTGDITAVTTVGAKHD